MRNKIKIIKKRLSPEEQSIKTKIKNVQRHLRIASASKGYESEVHIKKAGKLIKKYGFEN